MKSNIVTEQIYFLKIYLPKTKLRTLRLCLLNFMLLYMKFALKHVFFYFTLSLNSLNSELLSNKFVAYFENIEVMCTQSILLLLLFRNVPDKFASYSSFLAPERHCSMICDTEFHLIEVIRSFHIFEALLSIFFRFSWKICSRKRLLNVFEKFK